MNFDRFTALCQADSRCVLAAIFLAAAPLGFLPSIGISFFAGVALFAALKRSAPVWSARPA
jgi:hypothetical protein